MSKTILIGALQAFLLLALPLAGSADSGHGHDEKGASEPGHHGEKGGHGGSAAESASLTDAWATLMATRDAIADDIESGALSDVHERAEPLPDQVKALLDQSRDLDAGKRARVEGAAKQVARVADALHVAADRDDGDRTRKELSRLDGLFELIRAQYPTGALDAEGDGRGDHSAVPGHVHGAHAHMERPAGVVNASPQATVLVLAFDELRFEPKRIEVRTGIPTRIELQNLGSAEHVLVVKTPDGKRDWVHLHAPPGTTQAAVYQLDEPGNYPLLCTVPGHTEGGMVGELVVLVAQDSTHEQR